MKKYILIVVILFLVGCSTNKQIQLIQGSFSNVEIEFIGYDKPRKMKLYIKKQIKLKNPYMRFVTTKINYFHNEEQVDELDAHPMDYGKDGKLYYIGTNWDNLHQIRIFPLSEREIMYELTPSVESFEPEGVYKSLKQYISLGRHPVEKNQLTGETYENKRILTYEEPFSEFKRKNPELLEFLTKGDSIELEVISPVKQKYKFKAEW